MNQAESISSHFSPGSMVALLEIARNILSALIGF